MGRQGELDRLPRRGHRKSGGGGGLSRRSSEETRGKGGESDGTKLVQLEFVAFERGVVGTFSPMLFQLLFHALFFFTEFVLSFPCSCIFLSV